MNRKFKVTFNNNLLTIKNTSSVKLDNCYITLNDCFYNSFVNTVSSFEVAETKTFNISLHQFSAESLSDIIYLKIYRNGELIFDKKFNDRSKCFVVFSNQVFATLVEQLIIGLDRYSDETILHYTVGYDSQLDYDNLENIRFDTPGDMTDNQLIQLLKPVVFLDVLKRGWKAAVFLDADIQVRPNINDVFLSIDEITDGPIFQKSPWEFVFVHGQYIPGPLLKEAMEVTDQKYPYFVTNVCVFNQSHQQLFEKWIAICLSDKVESIRKMEFMHDELILNALMWKLSIKPKMKWFCLNVNDTKELEFFYEFKGQDGVRLCNINEHGLGHYAQSFIPYNKEEVVGFHCVKDIEIAKSINNFILKEHNKTFKMGFYYK
jgi:hypothetical protein